MFGSIIVNKSHVSDGNSCRRAGTYLNKLISHLDHGVKIFDLKMGKCKPIHSNVQSILKEYHQGDRKWLRAIRHEDYAKHFSDQETRYFTMQSDGERGLFMLDIDCHEQGTLEGAVAFAKWLKANVFPNLYYEVSTNGNGVHCYVVLITGNIVRRHSIERHTTADEICDWLNQLQNDLRRYEHLFDVEKIEIKGHPHRVIMDGRRVMGVKCGQLAKVPREISHRFEEFRNTAVVDFRKWTFPKIVGGRKPRKAAGSTGACISDWKLLLAVAKQVMGKRDRIEVDKQVAITVEDMAVLLVILHYCTEHPNKDGSMPTKRIERIWEKMFKEGETERQFNPRRYAAARNLLDQYEGIEWISSMYVPKGGIACKWNLTKSLMQVLSSLIQGERESLVVGSLDGPAYLGWKEDITRPEPLWPSLTIKLDADDVEKYLTPRDDCGEKFALAA